jgi:parallel beta-helix repeat protein
MKASHIIGTIFGLALLTALLLLFGGSAEADTHVLLQANNTATNQNELGNTSDGDSVWLETGTYALTAALTIGKQGLLINGTGNTSTVITYTGGCWVGNATMDINLANMSLISTTSATVLQAGEGNMTLADCNVSSTTGIAVSHSSATLIGNLSVTRCMISTTTGAAISHAGEGNISVSNSNITTTSGIAISHSSETLSGNISITRCMITTVTADAIYTKSPVNYGNITDCNVTTTSNGNGIYIWGSSYGNITNCNMTTTGGNDDSMGNGIYIKGTSYGNITNCNINTRYGGSGIRIMVGSYGNITNCNISVTGTFGGNSIYILGSSYGNITDCKISSGNGYGIYIEISSYGNIANCNITITGTAYCIYVLGSLYGNITNCNTTSSGNYNIYIEGFCYGCITDCNVATSGDSFNSKGIVISFFYGNITSCNITSIKTGISIDTFYGNITSCNITSEKGISIDAKGNIIVTNCVITTTTGAAISHAGAGNITVTNTNITTTSGAAISHAGKGNISVSNSNITTTSGIAISHSSATLSGNISVTRCMISTTSGAAIVHAGEGNITVLDTNITTTSGSTAYGIYRSSTTLYGNISATSCNFSTSSSKGIYNKGPSSIVVMNCSALMLESFLFNSGYSNITVRNSIISTLGSTAIYNSNTHGNISIDNCDIIASTGRGIYSQYTGSAEGNISCVNSRIVTTTGIGIYSETPNSVITINNSSINSTSGPSVGTGTSLVDIFCLNFNIQTTTGTGINNNGPGVIYFANGTIIIGTGSASTYGITGLRNMIISNTTITQQIGIGIYQPSTSRGNVTLDGCTITNIVGTGIKMQGQGNLSATNCRITSRTDSGIYFNSGGVGNITLDNTTVLGIDATYDLYHQGNLSAYNSSLGNCYMANPTAAKTWNLYNSEASLGIVPTGSSVYWYRLSEVATFTLGAGISVSAESGSITNVDTDADGAARFPYMMYMANIGDDGAPVDSVLVYDYIVALDDALAEEWVVSGVYDSNEDSVDYSITEDGILFTGELGNYSVDIFYDTAPTLSGGYVTSANNYSSDLFSFIVTAEDVDGQELTVSVYIDNQPFEMLSIGSDVYRYRTYLLAGVRDYYFAATDGILDATPTEVAQVDATISEDSSEVVIEEETVVSFFYFGVSSNASTLIDGTEISWIALWNGTDFVYFYAGGFGVDFDVEPGNGFFIYGSANETLALSGPRPANATYNISAGLGVYGNPTAGVVYTDTICDSNGNITWIAVMQEDGEFAYYYAAVPGTPLAIVPDQVAWFWTTEDTEITL